MTYVAARRFGDRIVMIADTKITNETGVSRAGHDQINDYLPGRLKAFPLSLRVSIGYAGLSDRALTVIRGISACPGASENLHVLLEILRVDSADGHTDYIVVSHVNGPEIFKVRDGVLAPNQAAHWIGDGAVAGLHTAAIEEERTREREALSRNLPGASMLPAFGDAEERLFTNAWTDLLLSSPTLLDRWWIARCFALFAIWALLPKYRGCVQPRDYCVPIRRNRNRCRRSTDRSTLWTIQFFICRWGHERLGCAWCLVAREPNWILV